MGKHIFHAGPVGTGHAIKLVNNMCSAGILALTIEAVAVAAKAGVDPARAVEIIQASSGRSNASDYKFPRFILNGAFDAGFAIRLMLKDVDGYARLAQEGGVPSMVGRVASEIYRLAVARGMAELDHRRWRGSSRSGRASNCGPNRETLHDTHRLHRRRHHGPSHGRQSGQEGLRGDGVRSQHGRSGGGGGRRHDRGRFRGRGGGGR